MVGKRPPAVERVIPSQIPFARLEVDDDAARLHLKSLV